MPTGAFNYRATTWDTGNISGLQKRVSILLGLKVLRTRALSDSFDAAGLELVSEEQFQRLPRSTGGFDLNGDQEGVRQLFREIPLEQPADHGDSEDPARLFAEIVYLKSNVVCGSILRNGIHLDRYRVGHMDAEDSLHLIFRANEGEPWWPLASYSSEKDAVAAANGLRRFLIGLNVASEGLHLLEHILLRPMAKESHDGMAIAGAFYSFNMSVVFPAWTARFSDPAFRRVAEETVQQNCPAHVCPEFHWLEFEKMKQFEVLYRRWLDLKCDESASPEGVDSASQHLIKFFLEMGVGTPAPEAGQA